MVLVKKYLAPLAILVMLSAALLVGCSGNNAAQENLAKNRQYMSSVNQIMDEFDSSMESFAASVKDGEVLALNAQLAAMNKAVDSLNALDVPSDMESIQDSYVKGTESLQKAMNLYVELYQDVKLPEHGTFDYATYNDRLAEVQQLYTDGKTQLEEADKKATEA